MRRQYAPLRTSFMTAGLIGFLVSVFYIYGLNPGYGVAFAIVFISMFIASFISMSRANPDAQLKIRPGKVHTIKRRGPKRKKR